MNNGQIEKLNSVQIQINEIVNTITSNHISSIFISKYIKKLSSTEIEISKIVRRLEIAYAAAAKLEQIKSLELQISSCKSDIEYYNNKIDELYESNEETYKYESSLRQSRDRVISKLSNLESSKASLKNEVSRMLV